MRVEIFTSMNREGLESKLNNKLKYCKPEDIIDIKFSGSGNHSVYSTDEYSAMIIYR